MTIEAKHPAGRPGSCRSPGFTYLPPHRGRIETTMTDGQIHHEFTLLQLAADRADDEVMWTIHHDQTRHREARIDTAKKCRVIIEQRVDAFYEANHEAIRRYMAV